MLADECSEMLSGFFKELRRIKKERKAALTEAKKKAILDTTTKNFAEHV